VIEVVTECALLTVPLAEQALMAAWCAGGPIPEWGPVWVLGAPLAYTSDGAALYALTPYEAVQHLLAWVDDYRVDRGWA
jgi:hypothetical protein